MLKAVCQGGDMPQFVDDVGTSVALRSDLSRIVSLVPSLTEALAYSCRDKLVGATDWCTHPADLEVTRVRGTKNPDLEAVMALSPDLVVANAEENRQVDLDALRGHGVPVWVTDIRTVEQALTSIESLLRAVGAGEIAWVDRARSSWAGTPVLIEGRRLSAVVPIWRRPWMHIGSDTYAGDVLRRLGVDNVLADSPDRYPKVGLDELPEVDLVVLPDEPYEFTEDDGPEAFPGTACALVSGRALTWYGPAMIEAPQELLASLRAAVPDLL
jgi:ABC-type Fe3+-hydroxamate transport system substrate-binding protein